MVAQSLSLQGEEKRRRLVVLGLMGALFASTLPVTNERALFITIDETRPADEIFPRAYAFIVRNGGAPVNPIAAAVRVPPAGVIPPPVANPPVAFAAIVPPPALPQVVPPPVPPIILTPPPPFLPQPPRPPQIFRPEPPTTAVPEPGTWAMLMAGFGVAGWLLRRRPLRRGATA